MPQAFRIHSWGNIGDALLLTPCLGALKSARPETKLVVYYRTADHRDVFLHNPHIDVLAELATAPPVAAEEEWAFEPALHWPNTLYRTGASQVIAEMLDIPLKNARPELYFTSEEIELASQTLAPLSRPIVAIHAASTFSYKEWYADRWQELIDRNKSCTFVQLGQTQEALIPGAIDLRGKPLRVSFALLGQCDALVGIDSGLAHAATAAGTPAIVLFGASNPLVFGHAANLNLYEGVECSPCLDLLHYSECPIGRICMRSLSVDSVHDALNRTLRKSEQAGITTLSSLCQKSGKAGFAGESACATSMDQQLAPQSGAGVSLPGLLTRAVRSNDAIGSPTNSDLMSSGLVLADDFALTFDWDRQPILFRFSSPDEHVQISENVRLLLSCFRADHPVVVSEALEIFMKRNGTEDVKHAVPGLLSAISDLIAAGALARDSHGPSLYSEDMAAYYVRARQIPGEIPETIAVAAGVGEETSVLDVGTGTGSIALAIAEHSNDVTGIDISLPFLEAAKDRAKRADVKVNFRQANGNKLVLSDEEYDVIVISQAFHWLDTACAVRGVHHALRPGGFLYVLESKPMCPADHPLKLIFKHGCSDVRTVVEECNRHRRWCRNLFEAFKAPDFVMRQTRTWVFHQRRPFDVEYARAFFLKERMGHMEGDPWKQLEEAVKLNPSSVQGDMYWLLLEFQKTTSLLSPFELSDPTQVDVTLESAIEILPSG